MEHLLEVKNLKTYFKTEESTVKAVDGVSYHINEGEIVAFVGESGSGKSITQYSGLQLIPSTGEIVDGEVWFEGENLLRYSSNSEEMRNVRGGKIGVIFQEPMTSLNPVLTVEQQITESLILHLKMNKSSARERAIELIRLVGIPDAEQRVDYYPHQFSGGMRQRIMIAMALSCNPKLLIADEATTALDVTTQAQILIMMKDIVKQTNTSLVLVTHNLGIVARYADRIYVMYAGGIVESGTTEEVFGNPSHPYTIGLMKAIPRLDDPKDRRLIPIEGLPPNLARKSDICPFLPRCSNRKEICSQKPAPKLKSVIGEHYAACYVNFKDVDPEKVEADIRLSEKMNVATMQVSKPIVDNIRHEGDSSKSILEVKNLKMYFPVTKGLLQRKVADIEAVDDVSFEILRGKTLGLVGESGCGKTTVARSILRMYDPTDGQILFEGKNITKMSKSKLRPFRKDISLIFQDPFGSLDPRHTVGDLVGEPLKVHKMFKYASEYKDRIDELFQMVGLDPSLKDRMPHEFSGGQRQRVGIARALASNPSLIVCDEAISALDVSIQAQIINLLKDLQDKLGLTYLFIAHDLSVVRHISDHVAVMYLGKIVEIADWKELYENPKHPYTKALLTAVPIADPFIEGQRENIIIKGEVPSLLNKPPGCSFSNRCPLATKECNEVVPELRDVGVGHRVACIKV